MAKERFIPNGFTMYKSVPELGIEVYTGGTSAIAYRGKKSKPDFYINFHTEDRMMNHVEEWLNDHVQGALRKEKEQAVALAMVEVGDVLRSSWGWEQTNIDFYQVVEVKGKSVVIQEIGQLKSYDDQMSGTCFPQLNDFIGEKMTKRIIGVSDKYGVKISSFQTAFYFAPIGAVDGIKVYPASHWTAYA